MDPEIFFYIPFQTDVGVYFYGYDSAPVSYYHCAGYY